METTAPNLNPVALSPGQIFWQRLKRRRIAMVGGGILIALYSVALFAGFVAPYTHDRLDREVCRRGGRLPVLLEVCDAIPSGLAAISSATAKKLPKQRRMSTSA